MFGRSKNTTQNKAKNKKQTNKKHQKYKYRSKTNQRISAPTT
jgi:hypothetical protein